MRDGERMNTGLRGRTAAAVVIGTAGLLVLTMSFSATPAASGPEPLQEPATCGYTSVVRDFLKPLRKMTPIKEPPPSGKLPFGPEGMNLEASDRELLVGGGLAGFNLSDDAIGQIRHLNWIVETELARVNANGRILSSLGVKRRRLGSIEGNRIDGLRYRVSGDPAFYRADIRFFRRGTGRLLAEYSTYARAVRPKVDLRVIVETPSVLPGDLATAKLVNMGTLPIVSRPYDYGFEVEALSGGQWIPVAENPRRGPVPGGRLTPGPRQVLPAGEQVRGCLRYLVPTNQVPGIFRFAAPAPPGQESPPLAAGFEVGAGTLKYEVASWGSTLPQRLLR